MTTLLLYFIATLVISFFCSLCEAVMLSVSHAYIQTLVKTGHKSGKALKSLKDQIDRPLAAILTLNTVAHTIGSAAVGAQSLKIWGSKSVAVVSIILTFMILISSEIIPKTLGAVYCKRLAPTVAYCVKGQVYVLLPIVLFLEQLSNMISPHRKQRLFSREEMLAATEIAGLEGTLGPQETRIIQNILALKNIRAKDVLTPRSVLLAFQKDKTVGELVEKHSSIRFSRIPIFGKDLDDITTLVHRYQMLQAYSKNQLDLKIESLSKPIHAIPETSNLAVTLDEFVRRQEQMFLVVDEYGGTAGIITLEDAIETLLGVEIVDEFDSVKDMRKLAIQIGKRRKRQHGLDDSDG